MKRVRERERERERKKIVSGKNYESERNWEKET